MPPRPVTDPWEPVLVTGSSGLIGSRVTRELANGGPVICMDMKVPDRLPDRADFIRCDLTDDDSVDEAFRALRERHGGRLASVVHLAAYYDFSGRPSDLYERLTIEGTRRLLHHLRELDRVDQLVMSSTMLVHEPAADKGALITEDSPLAGSWDYPASKIRAEQLIEAERGGISAVILRLAGVYDEMCHSIPLAHQIARIRDRALESHFFPGDASRGQPFVHLDDAVAAIVAAIDRRDTLTDWEVFLIAEPEIMSYRELQHRIGEILHGEEWTTMRIPGAFAKAGAWVKDKLTREDQFIQPWMIDLADAHYPVSIRRAETRLQWHPHHSLRAELPGMLVRLRIDPDKWLTDNGLRPQADAAAHP